MRQPIQVIVILYIIKSKRTELVIFKRSKGCYWQLLSGGLEENESIDDAVRREVYEETGLTIRNEIMPLETTTLIPADRIHELANRNITFAKELAFAVEIDDYDIGAIRISKEHTESKIVDYSKAMKMLKWDSNKTAIYELFKVKKC